MQAILDRILEGSHAGSGAPRQPWAPHMLEGGAGPTPHNLYCLGALEGLIERAAAYSRAGQPVKWGWCRCGEGRSGAGRGHVYVTGAGAAGTSSGGCSATPTHFAHLSSSGRPPPGPSLK